MYFFFFMVEAVKPDIDNIACANHVHGRYTVEAAKAGVPVIVLEKPPVVWPGYAEGRTAKAEAKKEESMSYLADVLDAVRESGAKLLYAEDFVYVDGVFGLYESSEGCARFVDIGEIVQGRDFEPRELPDPRRLAPVFQYK